MSKSEANAINDLDVNPPADVGGTVIQFNTGDVEVTREKILKGDDPGIPRSNLLATAEEIQRKFSELGALEPTFDPLALARLFEMSNSLRQNVDTMTTNVHGGGYKFTRVFDWTTKEGRDRVKMAMIMEEEADGDGYPFPSYKADEPAPTVFDPGDEAINKRIELLDQQAWRELETARTFFEFCNPKMSFVRIRERLGGDTEIQGHSCFEVRRNKKGTPKRLKWAPAWTMRALPIGSAISTEVRTRTSPLKWSTEKDYVEFRRFVQIVDGVEVYFKEFGDPRVLSSTSGKFYADAAELRDAEPNSRAATELWWYALDNPESEIYGLVRWSGNILSVLGSREMEEINLLFFNNKTIPPIVFMVSGGHVAEEAKEELEQVLRDHIKGSENFHGCLVLCAEPSASAAVGGALPSANQVRIDFKPLTDAIFKDQLWGEYDEANRHKVGQSFRIPPMLRGDTKDFNRATSEAALRYANMQIFAPERRRFDDQINRTLMPAIGVSLWKFESVAPVVTDPAELLPLIVKLAEAILRPEEARRFVETALAMELPRIDAPWGKVPLKYALAGFTDEQAPGPDDDDPGLGDEDDDGMDDDDDPEEAPDGGDDGEGDDGEELEGKAAAVVVSLGAEKFNRIFGGDGD